MRSGTKLKKSPFSPLQNAGREWNCADQLAHRRAAGLGTEAQDDELGLGGFAFAEFAATDDGAGGLGHLGLRLNGGGNDGRLDVHEILMSIGRAKFGGKWDKMAQFGEMVRKYCANLWFDSLEEDREKF